MVSLSFNPLLTSVAAGSFNTSATGFIVGTMMDDPAVRYALSGGVLAASETIPMWGGVGISELVPGAPAGSAGVLGGNVARATSLTAGIALSLTGFSVFNQDNAMVSSPQSPVPLAGSGMQVNFFRFGSGARIAVQIDPTFAATLPGGIITQPVSWDFVNQQIVTYQAAYAANVITAATWASTAGGQGTFTTTTAHGVAVGQYVQISGMTPGGYNGTWLTVAGTTGSTLVVTMPNNPGASTVQGTLVAGGGALPVKVLGVEIQNSMTVSYDASTGFATWNRTGSTALILI